MKDNRFFFIVGTHCSGKSSILKRLYQDGIINFLGCEIGKELYYQEKFETKSQDAFFEKKVARLELSRDIEISTLSNGISASETWHPGNIAYAIYRNPSCVEDLVSIYKRSPLIHNAFGIFLTLSNPKETIKERTKTFSDNVDWACEFYDVMQDHIKKAINVIDIKDVTLISADDDFEVVYKKVITEINKVLSQSLSVSA